MHSAYLYKANLATVHSAVCYSNSQPTLSRGRQTHSIDLSESTLPGNVSENVVMIHEHIFALSKNPFSASSVQFLVQTWETTFWILMSPFFCIHKYKRGCNSPSIYIGYNWQPTEHLWVSHYNHTSKVWQKLLSHRCSVVTISARSWLLLHTSRCNHRCSVVTNCKMLVVR